MIYLAEIRETRTYSARINAVSEDAAKELLRLRIVDLELYPDSVDVECSAVIKQWCVACGEDHFNPCPVPRKPVESQLIPPSWERKQL